MTRNAVKTLFHPFANGTLDLPGEGQRILFLGAEAGFDRPEGFDATLDAVQPLRPHHRGLAAARIDSRPELGDGKEYDGALLLIGKHRGENEQRIAEALLRTREGGMIVIAGAKEDGILALRKRLEALGFDVDSLPKYHAVALWFPRPADIGAAVETLRARAAVVEGRFTAAPGMFSHDRIDPGSELLASRFPRDASGHAADFGAGWGYLSVMLAEAAPGLKGIDLFEADHNALEAARANMAANARNMPARFHWQDLTAEEPRDRFDLIVMNPPFHETQAADPALGQAMIRMAAKSLKLGGRLMLVANRGLPYESVMTELFKEWGETCRNARFKVLWGRK
ncbi:methyltransferase [Rhizobium rhizosphaerae]|uniref:Methyltransferase n=1 Tax=Xaviernesmea rhizosphaerae TaxID=1672749 RepID=A0A1Q9ACV9_9HYPH|nr:class I SAM-dependent methyltransferase [Xaviernesmea rhizosphaerae]OLP52692.1 methyltransferase [Xaviernesmea rhizosphaerae]